MLNHEVLNFSPSNWGQDTDVHYAPITTLFSNAKNSGQCSDAGEGSDVTAERNETNYFTDKIV